jgi:hypothetical protein
VVVDLVPQLDIGAGGHTCVGDHRTSARHVALLERQARRSQASAGASGADWVFADETLQMLVRCRTITACLFELGERQQCVVGVRRQGVLDDDATVVTLGIGCRLGERAMPEQCITVRWRPLR